MAEGVSQPSVQDMGTPLRQQSRRSPGPVCPPATLKCCRWKLPKARIPDVRAKQHHLRWDPQNMGPKSTCVPHCVLRKVFIKFFCQLWEVLRDRVTDLHLTGVFHNVRQKWKHLHPLFLGPSFFLKAWTLSATKNMLLFLPLERCSAGSAVKKCHRGRQVLPWTLCWHSNVQNEIFSLWEKWRPV